MTLFWKCTFMSVGIQVAVEWHYVGCKCKSSDIPVAVE